MHTLFFLTSLCCFQLDLWPSNHFLTSYFYQLPRLRFSFKVSVIRVVSGVVRKEIKYVDEWKGVLASKEDCLVLCSKDYSDTVQFVLFEILATTKVKNMRCPVNMCPCVAACCQAKPVCLMSFGIRPKSFITVQSGYNWWMSSLKVAISMSF